MRVSRLTPFSRSQNSNPAIKSAFISEQRHQASDSANKKVGKTCVSDFRTLASQPNKPLCDLKLVFCGHAVKLNSAAIPKANNRSSTQRRKAVRAQNSR